MASEVPAVANAVRVLERIARDWPDPVAPATLIEELGLNRSTCYNILATLRGPGWVVSRGHRTGWSLGSGLLALTGVPWHPLTRVVQHELDALSRRLGFVTFAVQRHGSGYAVLAKAEHGRGVRLTVGIGDTFGPSAPAIMRAFHAWSDPAEADRLVQRHGLEHGPALEATRDRGYGTSLREYDPGQSGVSAPVFDSRGRVVMALCCLAFASELDETNIDLAGALIRDCGLRVTEQTGGIRPETGGAACSTYDA